MKVEKRPENIRINVEKASGNLFKTILWTEKLMNEYKSNYPNYSRIFRKTNLLFLDKKFHVDIDSFREINSELEFYEIEKYIEVIDKIIPSRNADIQIDKPSLNHGRILVFEVGITTHDGAPQDSSFGFVDIHDAPPLDTWFFAEIFTENKSNKGFLLSWVPKKFEYIMQRAIDVEIFDSYDWLDVKYPEIQKLIQNQIKNMINPD